MEVTCCPPFNPEKWDNQRLNWIYKKFIRTKVKTFWYMPLNFSKVITSAMKMIEQQGAVNPDGMCLANHISPWKMELLIETDKEIAHAENISLSGNFISKAYEGSFRNMKIWQKDFGNFLKSGHIKTDTYYIWYTTCPACAKKYGKNYVVFIAKI